MRSEIMDQIPGEKATTERGCPLLDRAVRAALVVYLSPVIVLVLAIGAVASLATRLGTPTPRPSIANGPIPHEKICHFGGARQAGRVRSSA